MVHAPHLDRLIELEGQGFREVAGSGSNQTILDWAHGPGQYPAMTDDSTTPWCGIGLAGVLDEVGLGRFIPDFPARAASWANCGVECAPQPGAIVVFPRTGGNHVTVIRRIEGHIWHCIGCNQSNAINTTAFDSRGAWACRWPGTAAPGKVRLNEDADAEEGDVSGYAEMLKTMQVRPEWQGAIDRAAHALLAARDRYKHVEALSGVPWAFIAVLHWRESSGNFAGVLHNGDQIIGTGRLTYRVPAGRGPFETWEEAAVDALRLKGWRPGMRWTIEDICERAEVYNGLGYRNNGYGPSPYLWSGTNFYDRGKYVSDGNYDPYHVDRQVGVIPLYLRLLELAGESAVRQKSRKLRVLSRVRAFIKAFIATCQSYLTLDTFETTKELIGPFQGLVSPTVLLVLVVSAGLVWLLINALDRMIVEDAKQGRYLPSGAATGDETWSGSTESSGGSASQSPASGPSAG